MLSALMPANIHSSSELLGAGTLDVAASMPPSALYVCTHKDLSTSWFSAVHHKQTSGRFLGDLVGHQLLKRSIGAWAAG